MTICWDRDPKVSLVHVVTIKCVMSIQIYKAFIYTLQVRPTFKTVVHTLEEASEKEICLNKLI